MNNSVKGKSVTFSPVERKIVEKEAKEKGFTFSLALRMIIREWYELKQAKKNQP